MGVKTLIAHHDWLMSFDDINPYLKDIAKIKLEQFAEEARSLDAPHIKAMSNLHKKYSLIACLLKWYGIMQLILSIQHGKVSSTLVLKRLGSRSRKNQLYRVFRELGRVIRTIFLLDYISDVELRESITAETNKVESFHNLSEWVSFASRAIVASNNTKEMEKAIRYNTLVVNLVILQNVIDMSQIIQRLRAEGWVIKKEDLAVLSPYITEHIKRFGDYVLNLMISNTGLYKIRQAVLIG